MDLKERARRLKREIPALFLALKRTDTPLPAKVFAAVTVCCALSPVDLVPDFIPVLGWLDDVLLLPLLAALTIRFIPPDVLEECRRQAEGMWADGRPRRWYYALPVLLFWGAVVYLLVRSFV